MSKAAPVKIGNSFLKSLVAIKEREGNISIEDVEKMFGSMADSMQENTPIDNVLRSEIQKIATYIEQTKSEIASMVPCDEEELSIKHIANAGDELQAVVGTTEKATNDIMDAADLIMDLAGQVSDTGISSNIIEETTKIYDACNFQDITGQRINKVISTLEYLDEKIHRLVGLIGDNMTNKLTVDLDEKFKDKRIDAHLMNGPQMDGEGESQENIDKLFN